MSPLVSVKTPVLQVWEHSALFCSRALNEEWSSTKRNQLQSSQKYYSFILCVFLWVWFLHWEGTRWNHVFEAVHRLVPALGPVRLSWYRQKFYLFSSTDENQLQPLLSQFLLVPENKLLFTERLIPRNFLQQNRTKLFHIRMKVHTKYFFNFQKKCFTFNTDPKSEFSSLLASGCYPVPSCPTLALSSLQALTDPPGALQAPHCKWSW